MNRKLLCYGHFCYQKRIKHDRDKLITYHHKHYCRRCFKYLKHDRYYRFRLYHLIENKAQVIFPTGMMLRDIKNYRKQRHYTYFGIYTALIYATKHSMRFTFHSRYFLHYVPYVYDKAQQWQYKRDKKNSINLHHLNNEIKQVSVDSKQFDDNKRNPHYHIDLSQF